MAKSEKKGFPKVIAIIVIVLVVAGAAAYFLLGKEKMGSIMQSATPFTSIKDALTKSVSLECEYTDPENRVTKVWIKNGAVRSDMTGSNPEDNGSVIMKDKKLWMWNSQGAFMMTIPDVTPVEGEEAESTNQSDQILKDLEEYKEDCKPAVVGDDKFTPPSDIDFQDMSKMMEGVTVPAQGSSGYSEEEVKKMMEQYGGQEAY